MTVQLSEDGCWSLLAAAGVGRLALVDENGPDIFPIDIRVHARHVYFRSAPGTKLELLREHPEVALEVDGRNGDRAWSVVVRGSAVRLDRDDEIEASGVLRLLPTESGEKVNFVRIDPRVVTGRAIS